MKSLVTLAFLGSVVWAQPLVPRDSSERGCDLTIKVIDADGRQRPYKVESFKPFRKDQELAGMFRGMKISNLWCGAYNAKLVPEDTRERGVPLKECKDVEIATTIELEGYRHVLQVLQSKENCWDRMWADWSDFDGLQLQLRNLRGGKDVWCALVPAIDNGWSRQESLIDDKGFARFTAQVPNGLYILSVYIDGQIDALVPLRILYQLDRPYHRPIEVDLKRWRTSVPDPPIRRVPLGK